MLDGVDPAIVDSIRHTADHAPDVQEITDVRARWIGHRLHAEVNIAVASDLTIAEGHAVAADLATDCCTPFASVAGRHPRRSGRPVGESGTIGSKNTATMGCRPIRTWRDDQLAARRCRSIDHPLGFGSTGGRFASGTRRLPPGGFRPSSAQRSLGEVIAHGRNARSPSDHSVARRPGGADAVRRIRRRRRRRVPHAGGRPGGGARADVFPTEGGGFHVKAGRLPIGPGYAAFKVNGESAGEPREARPADHPGRDPAVRCVDRLAGRAARLDRDHPQAHRRRDRGRGALSGATGVAGRDHLGLRAQGRFQLTALRHALDIRRVFLVDRDAARPKGSRARSRA